MCAQQVRVTYIHEKASLNEIDDSVTRNDDLHEEEAMMPPDTSSDHGHASDVPPTSSMPAHESEVPPTSSMSTHDSKVPPTSLPLVHEDDVALTPTYIS